MLKSKKMKLLELAVLEEDINGVIEYLGKKAHFEMYSGIQQEGAVSNSYKELFDRLHTAAVYLGVDDVQELSDSAVFPTKEDYADAEKIFDNIDDIRKRETALTENLDSITAAYNEAAAFSELKVPYSEIDNLTFLTIRIGKINPDTFDELQFSASNRVLIMPLGSDKSRILAASSKKGRFALDSELKKYGFVPIEIPKDFKGIPDHILESLQENIAHAKKAIEDIKKEKADYAVTVRERLLGMLQDFSLGSQIMHVRQNLESSQSVYRLRGWISVHDRDKMMQELDNLTEGRIAIRLYDPTEVPSVKSGKEKVPVLYRHNRFVQSFERIIFTYGAPLYGTVDPAPVVSVFFTLLFGIMFGDLGQGAVFLLLGLLLNSGKVKALKKFSKYAFVFIAIGAASMVMGFLTGEFFANGRLLIPVSRFITGLFGTPHDHILHLMPEGGSIKKLLMFFVFTLGVGFIINSTGLIINIINNFKLNKMSAAVFSKTGICGLFFFWYAVFMGIRIAALKTGFAPADAVLLALPLIGIFFSHPLGRLFSGKRPVFENGLFTVIIEGFVEILEVLSSYISNSVSFLRVGAFALSHAVLSFIIFTITDVLGGYLSFGILASIAGNLLIILLEGLIVSIQTIRLQYYEFFSKFFTETGKEFKPFRFTYKEM